MPLGAQIYQLHLRHTDLKGTVFQRLESVLISLRIAPGFQRRRGRTDDHLRTRDLRPHNRHIAAVIAGLTLLLVALLVLFIHDHQSQIGQGSKDGTACSHHDALFATKDQLPLTQALLGAQFAVIDGQNGAEFRLETLHHLRRERYLRDQEEDILAFLQIFLHHLEIHFRLAAARHAVKQVDVEAALRLEDGIQSALLLFIQRDVPRCISGRLIMRHSVYPAGLYLGYPLARQGFDHGI